MKWYMFTLEGELEIADKPIPSCGRRHYSSVKLAKQMFMKDHVFFLKLRRNGIKSLRLCVRHMLDAAKKVKEYK